jgi:hypothetical protein
MKTAYTSGAVLAGSAALFLLLMVNAVPKADKPFHLKTAAEVSSTGVCPPFYLLTQEGDTINPLTGRNADRPYSPKKTCGACHDYELITQGFHFQQGLDEMYSPENRDERSRWAISPGNYGGNWCSPSPLYNYLSPKTNTGAVEMDMTSFTFVVSCGVCHPGGGPLEYDRERQRYDEVMREGRHGFIAGGTNGYDGDYFQARWGESGVIEADCFICHLPGYDNEERVRQIGKLNFQWAASSGAGLARVEGAVAEGTPVRMAYDPGRFNPNGTIEPHIVREPRNEACLFCHAKPGYKKRGANFSERTDVHLQAGLKCVDCHPAGMQAVDDRIRGKEMHQFGKGDDPGGHVRDDLDNTMRNCADCHSSGYLGAPVAQHAWLPPLHLETMACQTCHIPERTVKSVHHVASDVFNPGAKIPTKGKHLWTFYGPDMNFYNHYGDLEMMGYDDKPTFTFAPEWFRYKDKIYPGNRVHSSWPGIETVGISGLMQPRMSHVYQMWMKHRANPSDYPELADITDDNGDGIEEVNRPEEIDALIAAVTRLLKDIAYPLEGKRVVWVMNNRIYRTGTEFEEIPIETWEASPYGNVHTYNHDVYPAQAALGTTGCTDCHSYESGIFTGAVVKWPFDGEGQVVAQSQYISMGHSAFRAHAGIWRESYLKPVIYGLMLAVVVLLVFGAVYRVAQNEASSEWVRTGILGTGALVLIALIIISLTKGLSLYMLPSRFTLDANHFMISALILGLTLLLLMLFRSRYFNGNYLNLWMVRLALGAAGTAMLSGLFMLIGSGWFFYTLFDLSLVVCLVSVLWLIYKLIMSNEGRMAADTAAQI